MGGGSAPSVSVTGPGGLTGLIQSALNQAFSLNWSSQPNSGSSNNPTPSAPETANDGNSSLQSESANEVTSEQAERTNDGSRSTSDDDTPATRRQRLDSEFVDLDCD